VLIKNSTFKNFTLKNFTPKNLATMVASVALAVTLLPENAAIARLGKPHRLLVASSPTNQAPILLPDTGAQDDGWSCGPNSAARVLRYYGHQVDYNTVRDATEQKLFLPQRMRNPFTNQWVEVRTGTPPQTLQRVMQRWEGKYVKRSPHTSFEQLIKIVQSGKPAIALVRVGGLKVSYVGTIPYLHWITVTGVDRSRQVIYYTDTNSQSYSLSYQAFQDRWNLGLDRDVSMAIANVLKNNGVVPRTLVWVDRN
jgi:hypothetical protein